MSNKHPFFQAKQEQERLFREKFTEALQTINQMDRVTSNDMQLLLNAASTISPAWVNEALEK
jgi:hypothetical protein